MYYKLLKLTSCENIVCTTDEEYIDWVNQKSILVSNPVVISGIKIPHPSGEMFIEKFILNTWIPFSSIEEIEVPVNQIITMTSIDDLLISRYNEYIIEREPDGTEPSLEDMSDDMFFEDDDNDNEDDEYGNDNEDEKTEEDNEESERGSSGRTGRNKRTLH
jgi:hypothetical protein